MASAFDGMGLGMMGSEKRFMTGSPISELTRMIPTALLGYGLYKSGAIDNLNDMFDPKKALQDKIKGAFTPTGRMGVAINDGNKGYQPSQKLWEAPPETAAEPVAPPQNAAALLPAAPDASVPAAVPEKSIDDHVNDVIPMQSSSAPINTSVAQNTLTPRDPSSDIGILQMASGPAVPPGGRDLQPVGQQKGGGGSLMSAIGPELLKLFLA
jgi:hypothetical protein